MCSIPTSPAAQHIIFARCDMRTLMRLRACSKRCVDIVRNVLRRSLLALCKPFLPKPELFVQALDFHRGFIGGSVAVQFMIREVPFACNTLDVFVPYDEDRDFVRRLLKDQGGKVDRVRQRTDNGEHWLEEHALLAVTEVHTRLGKIKVHRSVAIDALAPLVCGWSSLHITYVTWKHFGTAFPSLLFKHRGIVADGIAGEAELVERWLRRGFDLKVSARAWEEYRDASPCPLWVCHTQPRGLDDFASMRCRMRPFTDRPLISLVVWRLDSRPCGGRCLAPGVLQAWDKFAVL